MISQRFHWFWMASNRIIYQIGKSTWIGNCFLPPKKCAMPYSNELLLAPFVSRMTTNIKCILATRWSILCCAAVSYYLLLKIVSWVVHAAWTFYDCILSEIFVIFNNGRHGRELCFVDESNWMSIIKYVVHEPIICKQNMFRYSRDHWEYLSIIESYRIEQCPV